MRRNHDWRDPLTPAAASQPSRSPRTSAAPPFAPSHATHTRHNMMQQAIVMCTQKLTPQNTHTHTQPFNGRWSGTTRVGGRYQKKHSSTHTHPDHRTSFINFLHLPRSIASSVFSLRAWQSSFTTFLQVLFGLPLGLGPSTSYSLHFFHLTPQNRQ